ncbi:hypothetical protein BaRGS_00007899 [Batillaria attramentaria]|uniref:Uncharacterized protein n=1 Tax=Batillaria attramentaria TaxID=370345 RepID=A0ABD0LN19_9CAEN
MPYRCYGTQVLVDAGFVGPNGKANSPAPEEHLDKVVEVSRTPLPIQERKGTSQWPRRIPIRACSARRR